MITSADTPGKRSRPSGTPGLASPGPRRTDRIRCANQRGNLSAWRRREQPPHGFAKKGTPIIALIAGSGRDGNRTRGQRAGTSGAAQASSHREAPLISEDPVADNTDVYAFRSPDKPDTVTIMANYIPLEEPAGGPNFNTFGKDVVYAINIDNTADGKEDIVYEFRFRTKTRNGDTFLYNTGPIDSLSDPDWNPADLQRDADRPEEEDQPGLQPAHLPREHRPALDADDTSLMAQAASGTSPAGQGLRGPARRSVLRRPGLGLRPRRPAAVQPGARAPAPRGQGRGRSRWLQHALDRRSRSRSTS